MKAMIITKRSQVETEWILITPEIAKQFLECSIGNRPESEATVLAYARDMAAGHWIPNGETIVFDSNGAMRNGHHRCHACIKANTPFLCLCVFGVDPDKCDQYDTGKARTFRDKMILSGEEKWKTCGSVITLIRTHFRLLSAEKPTDSEIFGFMERNQDDLRWCYDTFLYKARKNVKRAGVSLGIFYALKAGVNKDELAEFAESIDTGLYDIGKGTAAYRFLKDLDEIHNSSGRFVQKRTLLATENAIKDFVSRKNRTKTYMKRVNPVWSDSAIIRFL